MILTPGHEISVWNLFRNGTMWLPGLPVSRRFECVSIARPSTGAAVIRTSGDCTLRAWVIRIARENGNEFHLILEPVIIAVVVAQRLEAACTACGFFRLGTMIALVSGPFHVLPFRGYAYSG